jgi:mRNA interferase MazF
VTKAKRGDLITIAMQGDFGKPRPALVIQADLFAAHTTVTVLLLSSTVVNIPLLRVTLQPDDRNGLRQPSQVMIDKAMTIKRQKLGQPIGHIDAPTLVEIERRLAVFLGIAK